MSTIKNGQILVYCHFNKITKGPRTNFQYPLLSEKHVRNVCHTAHQCLTKSHFDSTKYLKEMSIVQLPYITMPMVTSQILKSVDFTKTLKQKYVENATLFFLQIKKLINYSSRATFKQVTFKQNFTVDPFLEAYTDFRNLFLKNTRLLTSSVYILGYFPRLLTPQRFLHHMLLYYDTQ